MGKTLKEYAAEHPAPEPQPGELENIEKAARRIEKRQEDRAAAGRLKESILKQLERGEDPHIILYAAIKCIGLYSNDPEYVTTCSGLLDAVWEDLEQQSFLEDNEAIATERLEAMKAEYNKRLRNSINRQLANYRRIERDLTGVLKDLDSIEEQGL